MSNNENINKDSTDVEQLIELIGECIVSINTPEEIILVKDEPKEQLIRFIESMSSEQFIKMKEFLDKMPVCEVKHNFKCSSCGEENEINIRNISDFF
jgi:hypothetical protein